MICSWTLEQELFIIKHGVPGWQRREKSQAGREKLRDAWIRELEPGSRSESSSVRERGVQSVRDRSGGFPVCKRRVRV